MWQPRRGTIAQIRLPPPNPPTPHGGGARALRVLLRYVLVLPRQFRAPEHEPRCCLGSFPLRLWCPPVNLHALRHPSVPLPVRPLPQAWLALPSKWPPPAASSCDLLSTTLLVMLTVPQFSYPRLNLRSWGPFNSSTTTHGCRVRSFELRGILFSVSSLPLLMIDRSLKIKLQFCLMRDQCAPGPCPL